MFTLTFLEGDCYRNIPTKKALLSLWTELLFHNRGKEYVISDSDGVVLSGSMKPEDLHFLEQNLAESHGGCENGCCSIEGV